MIELFVTFMNFVTIHGLKSFIATKITEILIDIIKLLVPNPYNKQLISFVYTKLFKLGKIGKIIGIPSVITVEMLIGYYIANLPIIGNIINYVITSFGL